jgi:DNA-binding NarL/FixJ family response regulator
MDVRMPGVDGLSATRSVLAAGVSQVIVLTTLEPSVTRRLMASFATTAPAFEPPPALDELTARESEVLGCLGEGPSNQEIAARPGVGEATVKTHVSRVLTKLGLRSRVQAAVLAKDAGLVG